MKTCKNGHPLTQTNIIHRRRFDQQTQECRQCEEDRQRIPPTPQMAANDVAGNHTRDTKRRVILIGSFPEAETWTHNHSLRSNQVTRADTPRALHGIDPTTSHLILLPGYTSIRGFWLVQLEVRLLERRGATVEKA